MTMDGSLQKRPIDAATRSQIINELWPRKPSVQLQADELDWEAYFTYYSEQCRLLRRATATTHNDVVDITRKLVQLSDKAAVKQALKSCHQTPRVKEDQEQDPLMENSLLLGARLFVMMDIGTPQFAFSGRPRLEWNDGSLQSFVHGYFNEPPAMSHENVKLEPIFTAANLERVAGIQVEWTSNLADHLRMTEEENTKTVAIFHHASFLRWHQR